MKPESIEQADLAARYPRIRGATEALAQGLSAEDCALQSMPDASPVKWHMAHTSWFFETFVLEGNPGRHAAHHESFHPAFRCAPCSKARRCPRRRWRSSNWG